MPTTVPEAPGAYTIMDKNLAVAQSLKYAEELGVLFRQERAERRRAEEALDQLQISYTNTVRALAAALELRDDITGGHAERVTELALRLSARVAPELLRDPELEYGFLLHDLGKIGVPDGVLLKAGPLTAEEWESMRQHTLLGERIVAGIPFLSGVARDVIASHHERWDGAGYPYGLRATEIPLPARIFSVVDSFDAMTSDRPYRAGQPVEVALLEIARNAGTQFDPDIAEAFIALTVEVSTAA